MLKVSVLPDALRIPALLAVALVLAVVAVAPMLMFPLPPLLDYPFHVARAQILQDIVFGGATAEFFAIHTFLIPNVGYDVVCFLLGLLFDVETTSRLVIAISAAAALFGVCLLADRLSSDVLVAMLLAAIFVVNIVLIFGFMNFILGASLLPLFGYFYLCAEERGMALRCAVTALLGLLLFWCHIAAFASFCLFVGGFELGRSIQAGWARFLPRSIAQIPVLVAAALPGLLILASPTGGSSRTFAYRYGTWLPGFVRHKLMLALEFLSTKVGWIDLVLLGGLLAFAALFLWRAKLRQSIPFLALLLVFGAAFILAPHALLGGFYLDLRLPLPFALVLLGFLHISFRDPWARHLAIGLLLAVLLVRTGGLVLEWQETRRVSMAMQDGLKALPQGSLVLTAISDDKTRSLAHVWQPPIKHLPSIGALYGLFVPKTWAHPAQQPIAVNQRHAPLYELQTPNPAPVRSSAELHRFVDEGARLWRAIRGPDAAAIGDVYLVLLYPAAIPALDTGSLVALQQHERFTLFKVPPPRPL